MINLLKKIIIGYFIFTGAIFGMTYIISILPLPDPPTDARE